MSDPGPPAALDRTLTPDDLDAYLRLRETTFGYPGRTDEVVAAFTARLPRTHGAFVAGELASAVTRHDYRVHVAGSIVAANGFGAISTAPEHRRSGHVARLMRTALTAGRDAGQGWNLLYPFDAAFYARYGWVSVPTGVLLELPPERLPAGTPRRLRRVDGPAAAGLAAPYARAAATRTFADTRIGGPWDAWENLDGAPGEGLLRYASDDAFVALRLRYVDGEPHMEVLDLGWSDAAGRDAVWGALAAFRGHVARVRIHVPWDDPVAVDRVRGHAGTGHPGLMARVADVPLALAPLRAVADDDAPLDLPPLHLRVVDPYAAWNDGVWRLEPGPTGTTVTPSRSAPDATLDVRGLALLVSGAGAPLDARRAGWADGGGRALATVAALSGGRRPYRSLIDAF
ncbi:MAG: GNAT family N-acetyltransferase [Trueperaceae bacterium]